MKSSEWKRTWQTKQQGLEETTKETRPTLTGTDNRARRCTQLFMSVDNCAESKTVFEGEYTDTQFYVLGHTG